MLEATIHAKHVMIVTIHRYGHTRRLVPGGGIFVQTARGAQNTG